jgi:transposase
MDTSKQIFQLHGVDEAERPVLRRKLRRSEVVKFFAELGYAVEIGLEACAGSHEWARELSALGHRVKLLAPQHVRAYRKRGKSDAADAEAICEAMSRPTMRFVPVKDREQQAALMLVSVRDRLVRQRTQLSNAIRGLAAEYGLICPRGLDKIEGLLEAIAADEGVPLLARELFVDQGQEYRQLRARLKDVEAKLVAWQRQDVVAQRLAKIPGVGLVGSSLMVMKTPDPTGFRCGRDFAAWMGLTPKNHSTAGKQRLGAITRAGDPALRAVLVTGAMAVIRHARARPQDYPWLMRLLARKEPRLAAVALANKNARIAWKLMTSGEAYAPKRAAPAPALAA